ncbi:hypothetical protein HPB49_004434 [Dermacentor silvarum]|uniref:Uncharacterized protein n=1 Tax=Dermacentor silvarum TaxID=543639 RepID=A0ACB8DUM2_DERSI|nr:hypothetical protein HPB49_004434 [Dermacentor silvarum]
MSRVLENERRRIVDLCLQSYSQRVISEMTNRPLKTVNRIIQAYKKDGRIADAPRKDRKKVTSEAEDMAVVAVAAANPTSTVREIKNSLRLGGISDMTIKRRLYAAGLKSRTAAQKPIVSAANKKKAIRIRPGTRTLD